MYMIATGRSPHDRKVALVRGAPERKLWMELAAAYGFYRLANATGQLIAPMVIRVIEFFAQEKDRLDLEHGRLLVEREPLLDQLDALNKRIDENRDRRAQLDQATAEAEADRADAVSDE